MRASLILLFPRSHRRQESAALAVILALSVAGVLATNAAAAVYHVSPAGDDANPGTESAPWRTLQRAADVMEPGDTALAHAGDYEEDVTISRSGTAGAPVTISAAADETVTVWGAIDIEPGCSHLIIANLRLREFPVWGVSVHGGSSGIVLTGLDVSGGEAGLHFTVGDSGEDPRYGPVSGITVADCSVTGTIYTGIDCTPGPCDEIVFTRVIVRGCGIAGGFGGDGLAIERGSNIVVEDCLIEDNGGDGIDLNSRDTGGHVPGIIVRRNRVQNNRLQAVKLWSGGLLENNLVTGQGINPVMIGVHPCSCAVINNTIVYNMYDSMFAARDYAFVAGYPETGGGAVVDLILVNNIFAFNTGPELGGPTGLFFGPRVALTEHHNLYWSREDGEIQAEFVTSRDPWFTRAEIADGTWTAVTGQGADDVTADPLLAAAWPVVDAHLLPGSPAIDAGSAAEAPAVDLDGHPRDGSPDLGAREAGIAALAIQLELSAAFVHPGDEFWVNATVHNGWGEVGPLPVAAVLVVFDSLYFWPSWALWDPPASQNVDFGWRNLPSGATGIEIVSPFIWPATGQIRQDGLQFYAAVLNVNASALVSNLSTAAWGYGPRE